ncbi:Uu.00g065800.m01.CDS01 [Anthostomella pinea]|uniref:Uu.00g065800.m01.CDS01 n=1 Tax=Anthostomella pinea TaxID=933095 RepID=A0AAI8YN95_9PEZI|nr:Uu.00g065800.m01.CDS01 [Anthostomella pinea]
MAHVDQSETGVIRRLQTIVGEGEDIGKVLKKRVQIINVWRPLNGPVQAWPLACIDYRTSKSSDMHACDLLKGELKPRGHTVLFTHSEEQK